MTICEVVIQSVTLNPNPVNVSASCLVSVKAVVNDWTWETVKGQTWTQIKAKKW